MALFTWCGLALEEWRQGGSQDMGHVRKSRTQEVRAALRTPLGEGDTFWEPYECDVVSAMGRGKEKSDMKMASKTRPGDFCGGRHGEQCQGLGRQPGVSPERRERTACQAMGVAPPTPYLLRESGETSLV
ncbi:unnamed protein product [Natator depressus]